MGSLLESWGLFPPAPDPRPRHQIEGDIADELRFHLEERARDLTAEGLAPEQARDEARRLFGDFDQIAAACKRAQLGERIMLQRINFALILLVLGAVTFVGYKSVRAERAAQAELREAAAEMRGLAEEVRRTRLAAADVDPARSLDGVRRPVEDGATREEPPPGHVTDAKVWLDRFGESSEWRHGLSVAYELAALPPELSLQVAREIWSFLPLEHREQFFKPFVFDGGLENAVGILHLGATDEAPTVRGRAFLYLRDYAFRDFAEDDSGYEEWYRRSEGRSLGEVLTAGAQEFVERVGGLVGEDLEKELRLLGDPDLRAGRVAGIDLPAAFRDAGGLDQLRRWIHLPEESNQLASMKWAEALEFDENDQRALVLPVLEQTDERSSSVRGAACAALGRAGNSWAVEPLLDYSVRLLEGGGAGEDEEFDTWHAAMALSEIGDPRSVPTLIGMIAAHDGYETVYGLGYYGLKSMTGVQYDESHDGAWWLEWWQQNRSRFPGDVSALEVPSLTFDR